MACYTQLPVSLYWPSQPQEWTPSSRGCWRVEGEISDIDSFTQEYHNVSKYIKICYQGCHTATRLTLTVPSVVNPINLLHIYMPMVMRGLRCRFRLRKREMGLSVMIINKVQKITVSHWYLDDASLIEIFFLQATQYLLLTKGWVLPTQTLKQILIIHYKCTSKKYTLVT